LSLVAAVARLHNGYLRIEDNKPGLRVVIVLPSASRPWPFGAMPAVPGAAA
jgi:signal transduction histidine kinase